MISPETILEETNKKAAHGIKLLEDAIDKALFSNFDGDCRAEFIIPYSIEYSEIRDFHLQELAQRYRMNGWHKFILIRGIDSGFKIIVDSTKPSNDPRDY